MSETAIQRAIEFLELGQARDVKDIARGLIEQHPQHTAAHVLMARAFELEENWQGAFSAWKRAEFWLPNSPSVRTGLSRSLSGMSAGSLSTLRERRPAAASNDTDARVAPTASATVASNAIPEIDLTDMDLTGIDLEAHIEPAELPSLDIAELGSNAGSGEITVDKPESHELAFEPLGSLTATGEGRDQIDELNELINELEQARLLPDTESSFESHYAQPDAGDHDVVSETLARIYATQEQFGEAARVYSRLAERQPERAEEFLELARQMRERTGK